MLLIKTCGFGSWLSLSFLHSSRQVWNGTCLQTSAGAMVQEPGVPKELRTFCRDIHSSANSVDSRWPLQDDLSTVNSETLPVYVNRSYTSGGSSILREGTCFHRRKQSFSVTSRCFCNYHRNFPFILTHFGVPIRFRSVHNTIPDREEVTSHSTKPLKMPLTVITITMPDLETCDPQQTFWLSVRAR